MGDRSGENCRDRNNPKQSDGGDTEVRVNVCGENDERKLDESEE